jgi:hypothetical protein
MTTNNPLSAISELHKHAYRADLLTHVTPLLLVIAQAFENHPDYTRWMEEFRAATLSATDEQVLQRLDEREQFDDGGEPTTDDWVHWIDEGTAAFRSLAQIETAPQARREAKEKARWQT